MIRMRDQLLKAARMHAEGELERSKTNILVYLNSATGIGEHSDIVEAIQKELDIMATANDRLEMLEYFNEDEIDPGEDDEMYEGPSLVSE